MSWHIEEGDDNTHFQFLDPYDGSSEDSDESNVNVGVSSRRTRQQGKGGGGGGCRFSGRSRRFSLHHPASLREVVKHGMRDPATEQEHLLDVQMKCGSDSELWVCERDILPSHSDRDGLKEENANDSTMHTQTMDIELHSQFTDSGLHTTKSSTPQTSGPVTPVEENSSQMLDTSSERSTSPGDLVSLYKRKLGVPGGEVVELGQRKRQCVVNMEEEQGGLCV
ncbi:hypothetical protein D9C73_020849 [Collichthys lucidus]|uniref:Uncharacterized protein n=1 Tax=Collichthys lucidus TaxID=240159 RepID=A0A4U5VG83_COLLU|nr:hypothetical protein D9C73_020849 [Collichthys lucidus]